MERVLKRNFAVILVLSLVACLSLVDVGEASTWRVERDGSGDYLTIQPAVDASAPGDTILIGPGHYTEAISVQPIGWDSPTDAFVHVSVGNLTFIGSSVDDVIIGPDVYYQTYYGPQGFSFADVSGTLRVENLTVHNVWDAIYSDEGRVEIYGTLFRVLANDGIVTAGSGGVKVDGCTFENMDFGVSTHPPCSSAEIRNSEFVNSPISLQNTPSVVIEGCNSTGGSWGIQFDNCTGSVSGCEFLGQRSFSVGAIGGSNVTISNSYLVSDGFPDLGSGVLAWSNSNVIVSNCVVGGNFSAFYVRQYATVSASGCNIEKHGPWYFNCNSYGGPEVNFDFSNNYWGTQDFAEIAAGIWDRNDDSSLGPVIVFEPINEDPISASEQKSLGSLKAMFR